MQNPKFDKEIVKFTSQIAQIHIFITFPALVRELLDAGIIANLSFNEESFFLLNISGVDKIKAIFIHITNIYLKERAFFLKARIIPISNNSQTNAKNFVKFVFRHFER